MLSKGIDIRLYYAILRVRLNEMTSPGLITSNHIITERHKAEDIVKRFGWRKVNQLVYKGVIYWEIIK